MMATTTSLVKVIPATANYLAPLVARYAGSEQFAAGNAFVHPSLVSGKGANMRGVLFLLTFIVVAAVAGPQVDSGETFKAGTTLIQVPVTVRDHDGRPVSNLTKDDFQLFDNGKRQEIASFSVENAGAQTAPDRSLPAAGDANAHVSGTAMVMPARFIAYFFDDLRIRDIIQVREAALKEVAALAPGDRAAIVTSASCRELVDFTSDRQELRQALERLHPDPTVECIVAADRSRECMILKAIVKRMSNLPGQRDIVLVSAGFYVGLGRNRYGDEAADLIEAALAAKVTIDSLDVGRGSSSSPSLSTTPMEGAASQLANQPPQQPSTNPLVLTQLAGGTGGRYVTGNDYAMSFRRLATPSSHYVLSFAPARADGRYHKLKVQLVNAHKLTLESRTGYYAPKTAE